VDTLLPHQVFAEVQIGANPLILDALGLGVPIGFDERSASDASAIAAASAFASQTTSLATSLLTSFGSADASLVDLAAQETGITRARSLVCCSRSRSTKRSPTRSTSF
jgi:hypothetical protein